MNFLWITFFTSFLLHWVRSAPAVSSVHVSFVSGNKATEYSHGIGGPSSSLAHYNLLGSPSIKRDDIGTGESHLKRKRSVLPTHEPTTSTTTTSTFGTFSTPKIYKKHPKYLARTPINPKFGRKHHTSTTSATNTVPVVTPTSTTTTTSDPLTTTSSQSPLIKRMLRSRVKFVNSPRPTSAGVDDNTVTIGSSLQSELSKKTSDTLKSETKPKDSKAVKRSPLFPGENFDAGGIQFPDFDDFGGEEFGSLKNFAGGHGGGRGRGRGSVGAHTHANPESLSPDGVFLPPLPTEASDYADSDPYLADADTAKYAAQHPPFFAAFPHKRSVLALNEQRVHNGLEPNILRSLRPYFAFFDANPYIGEHYIQHKIPHHNDDLQYDTEHPLPHPSPPPPTSYSHSESSHSNFLDRLGFDYLKPNQNNLIYEESDLHKSQPGLAAWSIFTKRK